MRLNPIHPPALSIRNHLIPAAALGLLCACGGGGGGGGTPASGLEGSLNALGVSTAETPREGMGGVELGEDYAPFGMTWELSKTSELLVMGPEVLVSGERFTLFDLTDENGGASEEVKYTLSAADEEWIAGNTSSGSFTPQDSRSVVGADYDDDGLEEILVVYLDGGELRLRTIEDELEAFASSDQQLSFELNATDLTVKAADLNGDRREDLVVGLTKDGENAEVAFFQSTAQGWIEVGQRRTYNATVASPTISLEISTGNVDLDQRDEVLVVVNEYFGTTNIPEGVSRYELLDDQAAGFGVLRALTGVSAQDQDLFPRIGLISTPLIVDVDGDDRGELIIASRTDFNSSCDADGYFFLAFEDPVDGGESLGNFYFTEFFSSCASPMKPRVRSLHVNALDLDGDGLDEFHINQYVFDDFLSAGPWVQPSEYQLPPDVVWSQNHFGAFSFNTSSIVTGDFTGDARDDVAVFRQDRNEFEVWGLAAPDTAINLKREVATQFTNSQSAFRPLLVPVNVNPDGPVLTYSDAEYRYVFSEPIVLAVLAAAPCAEGIGQNTSGCFTAFGNTNSTQTEEERAVSVRASATVGISIDGGALTQSGFELKASAEVEATKITNSSYLESRTVLYTTGVGEDTVIFTAIPLDQYTYTVQSHPDPDLIGTKVVVSLPRDPITLQSERTAYNNALQPGSLVIDASVLGHTVGDLSSYPTRAMKNSVLASNSGLEFGPQAVGLGSGSTQLTLEVGEAWGEGGALEKGFSLDLETTQAGVLTGVSFGASTTDTVVVTSGESTRYVGSVGAIDAANHSSAGYSFGLFTYVRTDPGTGQEYEVIQYWVE